MSDSIIKYTLNEINTSHTDIMICHHLNDQIRYENSNYDITKQYVYNPHHCDPEIFKCENFVRDIDVLIAGVLKPRHYPLKAKLFKIINKYKDTKLSKYNIYHLKHPGYNHPDAHCSNIQKTFSYYLNKSKICISCTSKHKYRLGKYIEAPMCGCVLFGDIPFEDPKFHDFVIYVDMHMSEEEIVDKLIESLESQKELKKRSEIGLEWTKSYTTKKYTDRLINILDNYKNTHLAVLDDKEINDVIKQTKKYYKERGIPEPSL